MDSAKLWNAATQAFVLVLCITSMSITWHCVNEVARLQGRVERLEAKDKDSSVSQILGQLRVQTPVYQGDDAEEKISGHQREVRQDDPFRELVIGIVRAELEAHLDCSTVEETKCTIEPGPKGNPGPSGPPGPQGEKGDKGGKGVQGVQGDSGFKGQEGEKGEMGEQGLQGVGGERGEKGDMGIRGPVGEKGARGDTGPVGPVGKKGQLGYPGYKGQKGEAGEQGVQGPKGQKGAQGRSGPKGAKGETSKQTGPYNCGGTTGWTRVAYLDMTNTSHRCPGDMVEITLSGKRLCGRGISRSPSCVSATFPTNGLQYSQVCGRIIGYQYGATDGFSASPGKSIETHYVDGVSVTHGPPGSREHVWTFATGKYESGSVGEYQCPCTRNARSAGRVPSFVGQNYFCESGRRTGGESTQLYSDDPLWDGDGCSVAGNTCCEFNNPPYFTRHFTWVTSNDLEVRACGYFGAGLHSEDTMIELIELYTK